MMEFLNLLKRYLTIIYVFFAFCSALFLGALKGLLVGPIAGVILIVGNSGVILGLFPVHVALALYTLLKTKRIDGSLKLGFLLGLPILLGLWLGLGLLGSVLVGVGYGFFTPWVSAFEAFRVNGEWRKFLHCIVDGTWGTIKGSCTVVRDFADICYHSYPLYLKELRDNPGDKEPYTIRLVEVPSCIAIGIMALIVEIPLYTIIAVIKSPYMLFKGWQRLLEDLVSREGPFLETACVPVAGLVILLWPLVVIGSVLLAIFSSFFVALYGSVVAYQERSFRRGVAYVIAMVSEFDEYTNDWLYLREGSVIPKPRYRKKKAPRSGEILVGASNAGGKVSSDPSEAPAMLVPTLGPSRSVREAIQEVKMVQIWEDLMKSCEMRGKELVDANIITPADLNDWLRAKTSIQGTVVGLGLPSYTFLQNLLNSIKAGCAGLLLSGGIEVNHMNRPKDRLLDWFFHPVMVLKEQIRVISLSEGEVRYLEKSILFGGDVARMDAWDNGSVVPEDALKNAQIQAISRRLVGMTRSITKFPTYRRRFRQVVKALISYSLEKEGSSKTHSTLSRASIEIVQSEV
ncbi:putative membrane protein [Acorus calamus]|uniref:Membrane protein n=1 Tax=Acorus calamus TaxID=4465 RepID=A0AAV9EMJ4_ACOCL|nr:putative membrane protein [Acorus calamus]